MDVVDHSSHQQFFDYYAEASQKPETIVRFRAMRDAVLRLRRDYDLSTEQLEVVDVGCGAGTQSMVWAELGHGVHGLDVNQPLLKLARERATAGKMVIDFRLGSSTEMPWANETMDVCLLLELLEHVTDWQGCVRECSRILRRNGILVITTTNKLCPFQSEFNLPFYSWYPSRLKRHYENLASTSRPELANYATYPAVIGLLFIALKIPCRLTASIAKTGSISRICPMRMD